MKKVLWLAVAVAAVGFFAKAATSCPMHGGKDGACPMKVKGAKVQVEKTAKGVIIRIDGDTEASIREIQAHAAKLTAAHSEKCAGAACKDKHAAKNVSCPMKCYTGPMPADGRCPKCGMGI